MSNPLSTSALTPINWLRGYMAVWISGLLGICAAAYQGSSLAPCVIACVGSRLYTLLFLYIVPIVAGELHDFLLAAIARLLYARFDA
jgi:hypothetical protein